MPKNNSDMGEDLDLDIQDQKGDENNKKQNDGVYISLPKLEIIKKLLDNISETSERLLELLGGGLDEAAEQRISIGQLMDEGMGKTEDEDEGMTPGRIIEGVFDGENMIGPDGKQYSVPANYASKSKLVEGDILKLTITPNGTFVYKQIGPIDRSRVVGILEMMPNGNFVVSSEGKKWRVLTASVTYFKGQAGDETVILVPKTGESKWAAVENIVRKIK